MQILQDVYGIRTGSGDSGRVEATYSDLAMVMFML